MKGFLIFVFWSLFSVASSGQIYDVNWDVIDSSKTAVSGNKLQGEHDLNKVKPGHEIEITIEIAKDSVRSLSVLSGGQFLDLNNDYIQPKEGEENKAVSVIIKPQGQKLPVKMVVGEMTGSGLDYPYELRLTLKNGKSYDLEMGDNRLIADEDEEPCEPIDLFKDIVENKREADDYNCEFYRSGLQGCNAIIVIDASTYVSGESRVYRKNCLDIDLHKGWCEDCQLCNDKCTGQGIWVGDYVKIYLQNFNPYRYNVSVADRQIDAEYAIAEAFLKKEREGVPEGAEENATGSSKSNKCRLNQYADAVVQMKAFVDFVKNNTRPDNGALEENKYKILRNLAIANLTGDDIEELFNDLQTGEKEQMKAAYELAKQFPLIRAELNMLSYIVEATILPVKIRSFDKFEFTVTLQDKVSKETLSVRRYEYLIKGGIKVDQSFGVVFHGIRDREFTLSSFTEQETVFAKNSAGEILKKFGTDTDSIASITDVPKSRIIRKDSPSKVAFGASTLTHLYFRTSIGNRIRVGIGPEIGLTADIFPKTAIRYLVGGGVLFYDGRHRISFDAGCAFGLYNTFGSGQGYGTVLSGPNAQPSLVEQTGQSLYLGISYNTPLVRNDTQKD